MIISRLSKLALIVNVSSLLLGGLIILILFFTPFKNMIFSFFFGVLTGLMAFIIMFRNSKSMERQASLLKEGAKPVNHYGLYLVLKILFIVAICLIFSYYQFQVKDPKFNLIALACGYTSTKVAIIVSTIILKEKVIY